MDFKDMNSNDLYYLLCDTYEKYHTIDKNIQQVELTGTKKAIEELWEEFYIVADTIDSIAEELHNRGMRCICPKCASNISDIN